MAKHLGVTLTALNALADQCAAKRNVSREQHYRDHPKELFESLLYLIERRRPLPDDFAALAAGANLKSWRASETFSRLIDILEHWFPLGST